MFKRCSSLILCAVMMITSFAAAPAAVFAQSAANDREAVKGVYYTAFSEPDECVYSDSYFRGDSYDYNRRLSAFSYMVCNSSYPSKSGGTSNQSRNLRYYLEDIGFTDFDVNKYYKEDPSVESSAAACAHKSIADNGKNYTLLAVIPRSGTFGAEFTRSLIVSRSSEDKGDYAGYVDCSDRVISFVRQYVDKYGIEGDIKLWTTGYSGGGCIAQLFSAELLRDPSAVLGDRVRLEPGNLYSYAFSPLRIASLDGDLNDPRFDYIHNVYEKTDAIASVPPDDRFGRYGRSFSYSEFGNKERMLQLLKLDSQKRYETYISSADPDGFTPYKLDAAQLLKNGKLELIPDTDSYLPAEQEAYIDSVMDTVAQVCAKAGGGDSRKGFYEVYQQPLMNFASFLVKDGLTNANYSVVQKILTGTRTSVPMLLSMYMSFMLDKGKNVSSENLGRIIEESFNDLAEIVENEKGSLKPEYSRFEKNYYELRNMLFEESDAADDGRYKLRRKLNLAERSLLLPAVKRLTARLYAASMKQALTEDGVDGATIKQLTSDEDSSAMSWFLTNAALGNVCQSSSVEAINLNNEQFKQLATLLGNVSRLTGPHFYTYLMSWARSGSPDYDDYARPTEAQVAGYRRLYISCSSGADITGTVGDGNVTAAKFGKAGLVSGTDTWVGFTSCDSGSWLRLPADRSYRVVIKAKNACTLGVRIAECSVQERNIVRTVNSAKGCDWNSLALEKGDSVTVSLPAIEAGEDGYSLPSKAAYSLKQDLKAKPVIRLNKKTLTLKKNRSFRMKAKVIDSRSGKKLTGYRLRYSSSNKKVATVSSKGVIRAKRRGICRIYVKSFGCKSKTLRVRVK